MKRIAFFAAIAACTAALPAQANSGIGLLVMWIPSAILALVPAILIEAVILARLLAERFGRSLWISTVANAASTVAGALIAIVLDIALFWAWGGSGAEWGREPALIALVPMFFITWWLETLVVRRMLPAERKPRARRAALIANVATYALMAIGVAMLAPPMTGSVNRVRVSEVMAAMQVAKLEVAEQFQQRKAFPPARAYPPGRYARSLSVDEGGRVVAVLAFPSSPEADGRKIVMEPQVRGGEIVQWRCHSPDLAAKYLPAACR